MKNNANRPKITIEYNITHEKLGSRGNISDLYSGGAQFEYRSGHELHQLMFHVDFLS
jgi:hypothetical protein